MEVGIDEGPNLLTCHGPFISRGLFTVEKETTTRITLSYYSHGKLTDYRFKKEKSRILM